MALSQEKHLMLPEPLHSQALPYSLSNLNRELGVRTSAQLVDKLESAFDDLGVSDKIPTVREAQQEFVKSLLTYRDTVLQDVLAHAMAQRSDNSHKGKSTEWGSKRAWVKSTPSVGTSSMMSEDIGGVEQKEHSMILC
jgi:hypothetical protein